MRWKIMRRPPANPEAIQIYNNALGKKRANTRRQSIIGQMEMDSITKALDLGHSPMIDFDDKTESFLWCSDRKCIAMCSITTEEGVSGPVVEVKCGEWKPDISRDPEDAWNQTEDPYLYAKE
jgi:hypothetical protein